MLAEMKKFLSSLQSEGDQQTTVLDCMSNELQSQDGETVSHEDGKIKANRVKMAVLLGDQYLLNEFLRGSNTYTQKSIQRITKCNW